MGYCAPGWNSCTGAPLGDGQCTTFCPPFPLPLFERSRALRLSDPHTAGSVDSRRQGYLAFADFS